MSQLLTPASLEDILKPGPSMKRSSDFSKTQKNTNKINMLLKTLQEMDDDDASNLSTFHPPPKPVSSGVSKTTDMVDTPEITQPVRATTSTAPGLELNNLKYTYPEQSSIETYYQKYIPSYGAGSEGYTNRGPGGDQIRPHVRPDAPSQPGTIYDNTHLGNDRILTDKLNYMIHLLEDKQDVKSNSRLDELMLYCLLGIFTIFLVDSFSRVGKYVR